MATERRNDQRRERYSEQSHENRPVRRRRRSPGAALGFAALYVIAVIGVSILLACVGWIAANDVLALNKEAKTATITIAKEDDFGDVAKRLQVSRYTVYKYIGELSGVESAGQDDE